MCDTTWPSDKPIWYVTAEASPFIKVGGLGDVAGELPAALSARGVCVCLCLPLHGNVAVPKEATTVDIVGLPSWVGPACVHHIGKTAPEVLLFELPRWFGRVPIYGWTDDNERFAAFSLAVAVYAIQVRQRPALLHLQDWHTASIAMVTHLARGVADTHPMFALGRVRTLLTIHSMQYQGWHNRAFPYLFDMGFGAADMSAVAMRFEEGYQALRAGILWSDAVGTVSPTHAAELLTTAGGFGLASALKERLVSLPDGLYRGILNRIDPSWDPATDTALSVNYSVTALELRTANRARLHEALGLSGDEKPLLAYIGRLTAGKGLPLLESVMPDWLNKGLKLVVLGVGEAEQEACVERLASRYPDKVVWKRAYLPELARRIYGGADMLLMPSDREACGISQQIAMRYGCIPIARETGGLADTIKDGKTGFLYKEQKAGSLTQAVGRACDVYRNPTRWMRMMRFAMQSVTDWTDAAVAYQDYYQAVLRTEQKYREGTVNG